MEEMSLGPNGGLIYCFEFLMENLDFLTEALDSLTEDYLIIFDMPGQIELYTHVPILPALVRFLTRAGSLDIRLCAAYLLEATFVVDRAKFFAGTLSAMSAMIMLEIPHLNILSKMDLVQGQIRKKDLKRFLTPDVGLLEDDPAAAHITPAPPTGSAAAAAADSSSSSSSVAPIGPVAASDVFASVDPRDKEQLMRGASFRRLNLAVANLIESFSMVSYLKLESSSEESVGAILSYIDDCIQFNEAQEPKELKEEEFEDDV